MKQINTTENQMMHVVESLTCRISSDNQLPGKQVIQNILNYSRALEVLKKKGGEPVFLMGN
jgi:hypothetical protein